MSDKITPLQPRKKGWPKGKPRGARSESDRLAIAAGQRQRWNDPDARARSVEGIKRSYREGALRWRTVTWTLEMDNMLRALRRTMPFREFRSAASRAIGVSERVLIERLHQLGMVDIERSRVTSEGRMMCQNKPKKQPSANLISTSQALKAAQRAADEYLKELGL